jgi:hypothetical protein
MRNAFVLELTEKGVEPRLASRFFDRSLMLGDTPIFAMPPRSFSSTTIQAAN